MRTPVSVLIPTYNRADLIAETLDSILSQSYAPAQVIVVDDGSSDQTGEVVARFGGHVLYHYKANGGICRARNAAASFATSPYLAFCDSDDLWRKDKLEQQMELHDENPALRFSFTNFSFVGSEGWTSWTKFDDAPLHFFDPLPAGTVPVEYPGSLYDKLLRFQPVWPSASLFKREMFEEFGGLKVQFGQNPSEDLEFTLRAVQHGPTGIVREPVTGVRRHASNISADDDRNVRGQIEILEHVLAHHTLSASTRRLVADQVGIRRAEVAYGSFRRGDFAEVRSILADVPASLLDSKTKLKLFLSKLPAFVARLSKKVLVKD